ncbi:hypothetical protein [Flavobacterium algicola]|uniref:hypothetical protein n=1 Tax=Flavobacterium algicola TaxID=556529 RepID=UPI001EFD43C1|nr:hypothetical protein [Flavobacterium algicola]MCG9792139.1 hypothetical protein [Flavobacterium algicola]
MKKLILSAAIILGGLSTMSAQEAAPEQSTTTTEQTMPAETAAAETESNATTATASTETGFSEISNEEVPVAVTDALVKAYPAATLNKAFVNENNEYQLDIKVDDKEGSLFADESGKWIQN